MTFHKYGEGFDFSFAASISDQFGSKLLNDVLSHFTDANPHDAPRAKGYAEPKLDEWSAPECIKRARGRRMNLRKYMVRSVDRGKSCNGRPGPSPSPAMLSEVSFPGGDRPTPSPPLSKFGSSGASSPIRDRLPKSAQQFPILVETGWSSASMSRPDSRMKQRPMSQQSQRKDDPVDLVPRPHSVAAVRPGAGGKPLPFKHAGKPHLFGRHHTESPAYHGGGSPDSCATGSTISPVGPASPSPATSPEVETKSKMQVHLPFAQKLQFTSETDSAPRSTLKLRSPYASMGEDDSADSKDGTCKDKHHGIWNVALASSKYERLHRVTNARKLKQNEVNVWDRDKVMTGEAFELARDAFFRYFKTVKKFDQALLVSALSDYGIRARSRKEKIVLFEIFEAHEDKHELVFNDFCAIIEEARIKIRTCRFSAIFLAWRMFDTEDIGTLNLTQVTQLLSTLGLTTEKTMENVMMQTEIEGLHQDVYGMYPLAEVEYLIGWRREFMEADRRRKQRHIQEKYSMTFKNFSEFRSQILDLHECFTMLDDDGSSSLDSKEVVHLLAEFGICSGAHTRETKERMEAQLQSFLDEMNEMCGGLVARSRSSLSACLNLRPEVLQANAGHVETKITFPWLLMFVKTQRRKNAESQMETVSNLFHEYDKDKSGSLDMREVCNMIQNLSLQPRSPQEQEGIAELLEDCDEDGTGTFDLEELANMMVRIRERRAQIQRDLENAKAECLGISRHQKYELREAFETLDFDASGALSITEVIRAVQIMQWKVPDNRVKDLICEVDEDQTGTIDFMEFMGLMCRIDTEVKAEDEAEDGGRRPERTENKQAKVKVESADSPNNEIDTDEISKAKLMAPNKTISQTPRQGQRRRQSAAATLGSGVGTSRAPMIPRGR